MSPDCSLIFTNRVVFYAVPNARATPLLVPVPCIGKVPCAYRSMSVLSASEGGGFNRLVGGYPFALLGSVFVVFFLFLSVPVLCRYLYRNRSIFWRKNFPVPVPGPVLAL